MTSQTQNYTDFVLFVSYVSKLIFTWIKTQILCLLIHILWSYDLH